MTVVFREAPTQDSVTQSGSSWRKKKLSEWNFLLSFRKQEMRVIRFYGIRMAFVLVAEVEIKNGAHLNICHGSNDRLAIGVNKSFPVRAGKLFRNPSRQESENCATPVQAWQLMSHFWFKSHSCKDKA